MRRLIPSELRGEGSFLRWASAEGVSMLGTAITTVVLPLVVHDLTGSAAQTGLLFGLRVVPYLLFGLIAGPLADRGNRRRLIIGGNLVEGALVSTIPIAHVLGVLTLPQIYVVALLSATAFVFSDAAVAVGVDVGRLRVGVFVITSLLVGVVVARSGAIGFVGLMVPHAARRFVGTDHRRLLPWAAYGVPC